MNSEEGNESNISSDIIASVASAVELYSNLETEMFSKNSSVEISSSATHILDVLTLNESQISAYEINDDNKWCWISLYVVTIVLALLGNFLFLLGSACTSRVRNTGHYLLINLSLRDILLGSLCLPFTLDTEIVSLSWNFGLPYCIAFRYFYYFFLFFLPLTLLFLLFHLFAENVKWNIAGVEGSVPKPWTHTLYIPLIWFLSALFAIPTIFFSEVRDETYDPYRNVISSRSSDSQACLHKGGAMEIGSHYFAIGSTLFSFLLPFLLFLIPWLALLVQIISCCTRRLRSSDLWLSCLTLFLILIFEASRLPLELFNLSIFLSQSSSLSLSQMILPVQNNEIYKGFMKWGIYAPAALHPLLYFIFCPEVRHGLFILGSRCCSCCSSSKSRLGREEEVSSDDEKGQMLRGEPDTPNDSVPLQSKVEAEM